MDDIFRFRYLIVKISILIDFCLYSVLNFLQSVQADFDSVTTRTVF
jgi:hypothetical protein